MATPLRMRVGARFQDMLHRIAALQFELRQQADHRPGHPQVRELCELLDSLESSLCWDLEDDLSRLSRGSVAAARRILDWLRADIEPIGRLVCRLDQGAPGHPLVTTAMIGCGAIVEAYLEIEGLLAPAPALPRAHMQIAA